MTKPSAPVAHPAAVKVWSVATAAFGFALLAAPTTAAARLSGDDRVPARGIVRVLGARQIGQGALLLIRPTRDMAVAATVVDVLHAASMIAAAGLLRPYRRPALVSGTIAAVSAATGFFLSRQR